MRGGATLTLLGLATGSLISAAVTGQLPADPASAIAAHLNALLGAFWIFAVAWTLPYTRYGEAGRRRLAHAVLFANYANWLVTAVKAFLKVRGIWFSSDPVENAVFGVLTLTVVLPALAAAAAWVWGLERAR